MRVLSDFVGPELLAMAITVLMITLAITFFDDPTKFLMLLTLGLVVRREVFHLYLEAVA